MHRQTDSFLLTLLVTMLLLVLSAGPILATSRVVMWTFPIGVQGDRELYDEVILPLFEKEHPDIELEIIIHPWTHRDERMLLGYISGTGPDIVYLNPDFYLRFLDEGMLEPLERFMTEENAAEYYPGVLDYLTFDGQLYGFPILQSLFTYFYNVSLFREVGLDETKPPTNWEELERVAARLTYQTDDDLHGRWGFWMRNAVDTTNMSFNPFLWQAGGDIFSPEGERVIFDSPEGIEALTYLINLKPSGYWAPRYDFLGGRLGIFMGGSIAHGYDFYYSDLPFEWAPGPVLTHRERVSYGTLGSYAMFNNSREKEAAGKVLQFFTRTDIMQILVSSWGYIGPKRTITADVYAEHGEWIQVFLDNAPYTRYDILHPRVRDVYRILAPTIDRAITFGDSPVAALENAARQANALLTSLD